MPLFDDEDEHEPMKAKDIYKGTYLGIMKALERIENEHKRLAKIITTCANHDNGRDLNAELEQATKDDDKHACELLSYATDCAQRL
jgi:hypothetical protein